MFGSAKPMQIEGGVAKIEHDTTDNYRIVVTVQNRNGDTTEEDAQIILTRELKFLFTQRWSR